MSLPPVATNACENASILSGPHPVVIFSHGYTGMFTDATFLFEDLASRGYVIASVAHTYEATIVELGGGRIAKSTFGSYLAPQALRSDMDSIARAFPARLADLKFVFTQLDNLNNASNGPFAGALDTSRVAVMGHSLGAVAALASLEQNPAIAAAIALDPILAIVPLRETHRPVFVLTAGRQRWTQQECGLWSRLRGPRLAVNFSESDHFTPSDGSWLFDRISGRSDPDTPKTISGIREYVAAFLDANLLGRPPRLLLKRPPPDFTDVAITTSTQNLCSSSRAD